MKKKTTLKKKAPIKKAQLGTTTPLDTLYTKKTRDKLGTRTNKYVARHPDKSLEIGIEERSLLSGGASKRATRSLEQGLKYSDEEIRAAMNKKKHGGKIKSKKK